MVRWSIALVATAALVLSACGDGTDDAGTEPTPGPSASAGESPEPPPTDEPSEPSEPSPEPDPTSCAGLSAEELTELTGREQRLSRAQEDDTTASCAAAYDEAGMITEWTTRPLIGSFQVEGENAQLNGLDRQRTDVGGVPAWVLEGVVSGNRLVTLVAVVDQTTIVVETGDDGASDATVTDQELVDVATGVGQALVEQEGTA